MKTKDKNLSPRGLALGGVHDPIAQATIERAAALNSYLGRLMREQRPPAFVAAERAEGRGAIVEETARMRQERRAALTQALEDRKDSWTREYYADLPRRDFDLRGYERKLAAMNQTELESHAEGFATGKELPDPHMVDALAARLNGAGLLVHSGFVKQRATQRRSYEPWTADAVGAPMFDELKRLERARPDEVFVGLKRPDGALQAEAFKLDDFIDEIGGPA